MDPVDVLVALPARNEAATLAGCLAAAVAAGRTAQEAGRVDRFRVAVAAHRCTDDTAAIARQVLGAAAADQVVLRLERPDRVGTVRTQLIHHAMGEPEPLDPARTWVLSTDADSRVPADWVTGLLGAAARTGADLVAGLIELDDWAVDEAGRAAYDRLVESGLDGPDGHRHVYAANLAVRYATFRAVGGFPPALHGEERELLEAVAAAGGRVARVRQPTVSTSARMPGRAAHGLGALLAELAETDEGDVA